MGGSVRGVGGLGVTCGEGGDSEPEKKLDRKKNRAGKINAFIQNLTKHFGGIL